MKKILFSTILLIASHLLSSDELSWVDEQIQAIKPPRIGLKNSQLSVLKDPFISSEYKKKKPKKRSVTRTVTTSKGTVIVKDVQQTGKLVLGLILNHSVMINGNWYKLGDTINGYKISNVNQSSVTLMKQKKKIVLSTKSTTKKLNFNNK